MLWVDGPSTTPGGLGTGGLAHLAPVQWFSQKALLRLAPRSLGKAAQGCQPQEGPGLGHCVQGQGTAREPGPVTRKTEELKLAL